MAYKKPFHTKNEEDHKRSPVWHNDDACPEAKKILSYNIADGKKGNKCLECKKLNKLDE